ncbi:LytR C-terminal domain-containing protein [Actinokineospora terrae]|uniref:LytR cell envelope-related transcriptional attenuator n=1 Tax=Actinokineospora terrae TaxID=155974 RepID=A0A1H9UD25_9PSEU|nr:LytR C-terminal domain-containing protein [Actinokineospora terrae]SES07470.1 LytR cell envelope-related transcriptional attenuator [Actinokineospora terrae]
MSTEPSGQARTARVVGLTLLAVAAAAAVVGVITLFDSTDDSPPAAQAPPSAVITTTTGAPPSGDLTSLPPRPTAPGATTTEPPSPPQPTVTTTVPPAATTRPPATSQPGNTADAPSEPLRIYNNSTIAGLAARAADDIGSTGWQIAQVGNYSGGKIPTTTVYFEPGTGQEAAARQLASQFDFRVEPRFDGIKDSRPGLILIVTNDYKVAKEK